MTSTGCFVQAKFTGPLAVTHYTNCKPWGRKIEHIKVLFLRASKNMHQLHFNQRIDFENYSCMPWKGFPGYAYQVFTKNINARLAYFEIKKSIKDAVQSDLRMYTKEPSFYLQTVYLGFYFILCSCKA
jgi:hypothetical protein